MLSQPTTVSANTMVQKVGENSMDRTEMIKIMGTLPMMV